jgi:dTDP-4-dehydrorhamnose 3,5-epimerase
MKFESLDIPGLMKITPDIFGDARGFFMEVHHKDKFKKAGLDINFVQDNQSRSTKGTLRGLHYQANPKAQGKLVRVLHGRIFDVALDIRDDSPSKGKWVGLYLDDIKREMLYVPPGFAHGFYVVSESADIEYKCTDTYSPEHEHGFHWESAGIKWPISTPPILSEKDAKLPHFI